jgi:hypothetical protein
MFQILEGRGILGGQVKNLGGDIFAACPPSRPCQSRYILLEHWNIGTKQRKSMILLKKSCSKHFLILEQTAQAAWNKIF